MPSDKRGTPSGPEQQTAEHPVADVRQESVSGVPRTNGNISSQEKVVLTEMAAHLKSLEQQLTAQPEIDQAHVDNIREAISRGEYRIDPQRVAGKMVDFESDF